jgi:hypothetical protein
MEGPQRVVPMATEGNESGSDGGGVAMLGGNLIAYDSAVRGNLSGGAGGGVALSGELAPLIVERSTLSGNAALEGAGVRVGSAGPSFHGSLVGDNLTGPVFLDGFESADAGRWSNSLERPESPGP